MSANVSQNTTRPRRRTDDHGDKSGGDVCTKASSANYRRPIRDSSVSALQQAAPYPEQKSMGCRSDQSLTVKSVALHTRDDRAGCRCSNSVGKGPSWDVNRAALPSDGCDGWCGVSSREWSANEAC